MIPFLSAIPGVIASKATYHVVKANGGSKEEALAAGTGVAVAVSAVMLDPLGGAAAHAATHAASHAVSHGVSHAVSHGTSHAVSHGTSHAVGHGAGQATSHGAGQATSHGAGQATSHGAGQATSPQVSPRAALDSNSMQSYGAPHYKDGQHVELLAKANYANSSVPVGTQGVVLNHKFGQAGQVIDIVKVDPKWLPHQSVDIADSLVKVLTGKG